jgi:hypothetical protein
MHAVALGRDFLRIFRFSSVSIIQLLLRILSHIIWGMGSGPISGLTSTETVSSQHNNKMAHFQENKSCDFSYKFRMFYALFLSVESNLKTVVVK